MLPLNIIQRAMVQLRFLREYGWIAVEAGAHVQLGLLIVWGLFTLLAYPEFKA